MAKGTDENGITKDVDVVVRVKVSGNQAATDGRQGRHAA